MRKKINEKIYDYLNEQFRVKLPEALADKFGQKLGFQTRWNLFAGAFGALQTTWKKTTPKKKKEIQKYVAAYEKGYCEAMRLVSNYEENKK